MTRPAGHVVLPVMPCRVSTPTPTVRRASLIAGGLVSLTTGAVGLSLAGLIPDTPLATAVLAFALLVAGVPHGSFDLALLRRAGATGTTAQLVLLYLACATAMYLVWRIAPVLALAAFLIMAVVHFAEDWTECGSRFIAIGIAAAIVAAPAIQHGPRLRELFVMLTGDAGAAVLVDILLLIGPVAGAVALVGMGMLWQAGCKARAVSAGCGVMAMLLLSPVAGFALFFCLVHSPLQFRDHANALGLKGFGNWGSVVLPISLGGLALAVVVFVLNGGTSMTAGVFEASFMTLSVLTVPHMLVPLVATKLKDRRSPTPR